MRPRERAAAAGFPQERRASTVSTTLILIRHGATAANVCRPYILQGARPDGELVDAGRAQARAVGAALQPLRVRAIHTSPMRRARQTAALVREALDRPVHVADALAEADFGEWSGLTWPEVEGRWGCEVAAFRADPERHGYPGGETLAQVRDRVLPAILHIAARHAGDTVAVVAHGTVNRVLLAHWLGVPIRAARQIPQDNGGISTVEFADGSARVRTVNAVAHLAGGDGQAA